MHDTPADTLVLVFTHGMSLKAWSDTGMLEREWALYDRLLETYDRVVLVTHGDGADGRYLAPLLRESQSDRVFVVCNRDGVPGRDYGPIASKRVLDLCGRSRGVVVKTNQMSGGELAVEVTGVLRTAGVPTALIARGGYLWTRFVAHEHGPDSERAVHAGRRERLVCQAADVVVGTTRDMVDDLAWRYGLDPQRTLVIPNYVLEEDDALAGVDREEGLVLYAGQLCARKRVHLLIEAVAQVAGARLEVIGEGPEEASLRSLAERLSANVVFRARVPHMELLRRMRAASVYAQASELEGHPKTVIEAMVSGSPVVVADAPGLGEVVVQGSTGLRVPADAGAFAHAIGELLADSEWRSAMGAAASRAARAAYGLGAVLPLELAAHRLALRHALGAGERARVAG